VQWFLQEVFSSRWSLFTLLYGVLAFIEVGLTLKVSCRSGPAAELGLRKPKLGGSFTTSHRDVLLKEGRKCHFKQTWFLLDTDAWVRSSCILEGFDFGVGALLTFRITQ
jgi:hypothetical protein